jgi:CHAT domain-containing protein
VYSTRQLRLTAIAAEHAHDAALPPLCYVAQEVREITELAVAARMTVQSLTSSARETDVLRTFQAADVVHITCHGIQDPDAPRESHFCLSTGNVAVSALMEVDLQDADRRHADEAVHLAAAMIFAGYRSVVATMWCVCR